MSTVTKQFGILAALALLTLAAGSVSAQPFNVQIDEYGVGTLNGNPLPASIGTDPISNMSTLMYTLPFAVTRGDVILLENTGLASDIIRFDTNTTGSGVIYFFSDPLDASDIGTPLADVGLPTPFSAPIPVVTLSEIGPEGSNGAVYNAQNSSTDPGVALTVGAIFPVTYTILSDSIPVPEPSALVLLGMSILGLAAYAWRKRMKDVTARTNLILACASLVLAVAAAAPAAGANLLVDPDFNGAPPLNTFVAVFGPPFILGQWGAENGAIVAAGGGVTPLTASTMLAEYSPAGGYTQTLQVTDVSSDPASSTYTLSAYFDVPQNLSAAHAYVNISFYDASNNPLGGPPSAGLILDNNPATWQPISITATEPLNTKYIVSQVLYDESTLSDSTGATQPGYVDSASLTLVPVPEPSSVLLAFSGLAALVWYARRKRR